MKYDTSMPIYLQVVRQIEKEIASGRRKPGEKMPSTRDLALAFQINPNTASRVYQVLESEHICMTKRGLGTFVSEDADMVKNIRNQMAKESIAGLISSLKELGYSEEEMIQMIKENWKDA
ncbi:MAG: GntR family transcriptional regulator [Lactimicrobium sp.]|jgi:GntR family transcriptional regulator|uniref:GntR family transcriptional regulator n=1 Tax=Lactimicrobium sp. TaxID=2563780 RepID=UPI002F35E177